MKYQCVFLLLIIILTSSCTTERIKLLNQAEAVIPGNWKIESIKLPKDPMGITYQGNTFYIDTILFDIGSIEIPEFSTDTLDYSLTNRGKVRCTVTIGNENFPYGINSLFLSGDEIFSFFEPDGPPGSFLIDTPGEKFLWSTFAFNNNYFITIIDHNNIILSKANDRHDYVISLGRQ